MDESAFNNKFLLTSMERIEEDSKDKNEQRREISTESEKNMIDNNLTQGAGSVPGARFCANARIFESLELEDSKVHQLTMNDGIPKKSVPSANKRLNSSIGTREDNLSELKSNEESSDNDLQRDEKETLGMLHSIEQEKSPKMWKEFERELFNLQNKVRQEPKWIIRHLK